MLRDCMGQTISNSAISENHVSFTALVVGRFAAVADGAWSHDSWGLWAVRVEATLLYSKAKMGWCAFTTPCTHQRQPPR